MAIVLVSAVGAFRWFVSCSILLASCAIAKFHLGRAGTLKHQESPVLGCKHYMCQGLPCTKCSFLSSPHRDFTAASRSSTMEHPLKL